MLVHGGSLTYSNKWSTINKRNIKVKISKMSAKLAGSFGFVTAFLLISIVSGDSFGKVAPAKGEEPTYTITMNASNVPTTSEIYTSVETDIRYSHFEYVDAKASSGNHVELNTEGYIINSLDSQITSIFSITAVFSTEGTLNLGTSYYGVTFTTVPLTSGVTHDVSAALPYYLKLTAIDTLATITSVTIVYSCVPNEAVLEAGDNYYLGSYPQTKVSNASLITTLNSLGGTLPTSANSQTWTSYQYYISSSKNTKFMWYKDVINSSVKYRGVYFTQYRPHNTTYWSDIDTSNQDNNGYYINTTYWFKYEPILWNVLSVNETGGPLLVADMILDSREYYHTSLNRTIGGATVYPNNYKESNIRSWLNSSFYNQSFSSSEQSSISTTIVDNSVASTGYTTNTYACENTNDKVLLLSFLEADNADYGFSSDASRIRQATDYAKANGIWVNISNSNWWLRSPHYRYEYDDGYDSWYSSSYGTYDYIQVYAMINGVLPAFRINQ
jgi:hypothetical protein